MASSATISDTTPPASIRATRRAERGALLFAVKGCIGCHTHAAFPNARMQVGPDLTGLAMRAATSVPASTPARTCDSPFAIRAPIAHPASTAVMPDLRLSDDEVEALTAFLLSSTR